MTVLATVATSDLVNCLRCFVSGCGRESFVCAVPESSVGGVLTASGSGMKDGVEEADSLVRDEGVTFEPEPCLGEPESGVEVEVEGESIGHPSSLIYGDDETCGLLSEACCAAICPGWDESEEGAARRGSVMRPLSLSTC